MKIKALLGILFFTSFFPAYAIAGPLIDEIKMEGVAPDQVDVLKAVSGFLPGDEYDRLRVTRAAEKLKDFFDGKGYPQAIVNPDLEHVREKDKLTEKEKEKNILSFRFKLGDPIKIVQVSFESKDESIPPELKARLLQAIELKPNELFDRDRVKDMKRTIESTLSSLNFVDSRVTEVNTDLVPTGMKIEFVIELGQRVIFSVFGNDFFTRTELMALIEDQRAVGLGRDYVNVIANQLREKYLDVGFRRIQIIPYTFESKGKEPRKVAYEITEGPKTKIRNVIFDGNEVFTDSELDDLFFKNAADRIQSRIYNEKMVEAAAKSMVQEIKSRGYLSAKLIAIKTEDIPNSADVNLRVFVNEGLQTKVQSIDFHGTHVISNEKLVEYLGIREGDALNLVQLEDGLDRIKKEYRNLGYLNVKVTNEINNQIITYSEKNQYAYLTFEIEEGPQFVFTGLQIFGNEKTKQMVIEREFRLRAGEPLQENKLNETEDRLRRLGIFSQVNLELVDDPNVKNGKIAKISVQEGTPGNAGTGIGFRNDLGIRLFAEVSYANLWGDDHTWVFNVSGNRRISDYRFTEYSAQVSYIWPWVFGGETVFRPSITSEKREYTQFDAQTFAYAMSLDRSLYKPLHISGSVTYTLEQIRQFDAQNSIDNQQVRIGSLTPRIQMDLRDNPLAPRHGFFGLVSFEYANPWLGTQSDPVVVSYGRFQVKTDFYTDIIPRVVLYGSVRGGWLKNFVSQYNPDGTVNPLVGVPLIKQFALGGVNSLRGFVEQELNYPNLVPGSMTYVNYRTQMDYFVSRSLSFGPFLDAGNLDINEFSFGNLRYGTGMGMRYTTPVGPINFDWGFKLFPRPGEQNNVFYFSLGVI